MRMLLKKDQGVIMDLIFMLPYAIMFFTYLLFTMIITGVMIVIGYLLSMKGSNVTKL